MDVSRADIESTQNTPTLDDLGPRGLFLDKGKTRFNVADSEALAALVPQFDVVLQGDAVASRLKFRPNWFVEQFAQQLLVTITPTADLDDALGVTEFMTFHQSGLGHITPRALAGQPTGSLPPLRPKTHLLEMIAGYQAAIATMALLTAGMHEGNALHVSIVDAALPLLRRELSAYQHEGVVASRGERLWKVAPAGLIQCSDGLAFIDVVDNGQWRRLCSLIDRADLLDDERLVTSEQRFNQPELIENALAPWFQRWRVWEAVQRCQAGGVPIAPVSRMDDLVVDPQLVSREFFEPASRVPRLPWKWQPANETAAPIADRTPGTRPTASALSTTETKTLPLHGYRIVEFTHVWAGPLCGQVLADLGADVIKIESRRRVDVHRQAGPYVGQHRGIDASGVWNSQNRGKRSCAINLMTPEGVELARQLVAHSDVVIENFSPGTLARRGLGFEELSKVQPSIVLASLSAYGQTGPLRSYLGYGPMMDAACGLMALTDYGDGVPRAVNGWAADVGGALNGALQVVAALYWNQLEPTARWADVSEFECAVIFQFNELLRSDPLIREAHPTDAADTQFDVCIESGDADRWVAISLRGAEERRVFADLIGADPDLSSKHLTDVASAWATAYGSRKDVLAVLASVGLRACPVTTAADLVDDGDTRPRRFVQTHHSVVGPMISYGPSWWLLKPTGLNEMPAPALGEHTDSIMSNLLGLRMDEIAGLVERSVLT